MITTPAPSPLYNSRGKVLHLLTARQEADLAAKIRAGDLKARNELVKRNLPLVRYALLHIVEPNALRVFRADLEQEGMMGLMRAADRYHPPVRFASWALQWIRSYVWRWLRNCKSVVSGGMWTGGPRYRYRGDVYTTPDDRSVCGCIASPVNQPDFEIIRRETSTFVRGRLESFDCCLREKIILKKRLLEDPPATLEEVGEVLGLTRERIRQIESRVVPRFVKMLRHAVEQESARV
jgi:RNA polymerase primary sigma factor